MIKTLLNTETMKDKYSLAIASKQPYKFIIILALVIPMLIVPGCNNDNHPGTSNKKNENGLGIKLQGEAQGTTYTIIYLGDTVNYQNEIDSILRRYDQDLSLWVPNSLLNQINNHHREDTVFVFHDSTKYFSVVFQTAKDIWKKTGGAFDPSVYPYVQAWGFGLKNKEKITPELIDSLKPLTGFSGFDIYIDDKYKDKYIYDRTEIVKLNPLVKLDFNGIAQGNSIDVISNFLQEKGIDNFMVEIGGELYCKGLNQHQKPWNIAIDSPKDNGEYQEVLSLTDRAVATSGNYRKYYEENGVKYSHTIDPKTGYPVTHSLLSVSVVADAATDADGYATAFLVMGEDKTLEFLRNHPELNLAVYMIYDDHGKYRVAMSDNMKQYLRKNTK